MHRVRIGCSGWSYDDWRGGLYPDALPKRRWQVPGDFLFAVKASRYLTHMKRLREDALSSLIDDLRLVADSAAGRR